MGERERGARMATPAPLHDRPRAWPLVMHRAREEAVYCRTPVMTDEERTRIPVAEEEANAFGAALLMPADLVRAQYAATGGDFHRLCSVFQASGAAMGRRLHAVVPRKS